MALRTSLSGVGELGFAKSPLYSAVFVCLSTRHEILAGTFIDYGIWDFMVLPCMHVRASLAKVTGIDLGRKPSRGGLKLALSSL